MITPKQHLTDADFSAWETGSLSPEEMEEFLMHTSECEHCAERFMQFMMTEEAVLYEPPAYLTEEIINRSQQPDLFIARKVKQTSKQLRLLTYSLKVCSAVVFSIIMLFSINLTSLQLQTVSTAEPNAARMSQIEREYERQQLAISEMKQENSRKQEDTISFILSEGADSVGQSLRQFAKQIFHFPAESAGFKQED